MGIEVKKVNEDWQVAVPLAWLENIIRESERARMKFSMEQMDREFTDLHAEVQRVSRNIDSIEGCLKSEGIIKPTRA